MILIGILSVLVGGRWCGLIEVESSVGLNDRVLFWGVPKLICVELGVRFPDPRNRQMLQVSVTLVAPETEVPIAAT